MRAIIHAFRKSSSSALVALLASAALLSGGSPVLAAPVAIELCAVPGSVTMPGAVVIPIWGFGVPTTPGDCGTATASLPGPVLAVNENDTVTISVRNALPTTGATADTTSGLTTLANVSSTAGLAPGMTVAGSGIPSGTTVVSIDGPAAITISSAASSTALGVALTFGHRITLEAPGVAFSAGPTDADPGAVVSRTFTVVSGPSDADSAHTRPGAYLYESGGDAGRQEAMGLYGALIVRSGTAGQAYDDAATAYDVEAPLVLSQLDPAFNAAPSTYDLHLYRATYWLINGHAHPDTARITAVAGQRVLLRYLNAGYDNTTMALLGMHERILARDSRLLTSPYLASAETIPAGGSVDAIAVVPSAPPPSGSGFPLYNRQLHVTNGTPPSADYSPGGMMTFIGP